MSVKAATAGSATTGLYHLLHLLLLLYVCVHLLDEFHTNKVKRPADKNHAADVTVRLGSKIFSLLRTECEKRSFREMIRV